MYLDGQLPHGPASTNRGGQVTPNGVSALFDGEMGEPVPSPMPQDLSGSTFFTLRDGGPVVISPSLALANGVVQYPVNPMRGYRRGDSVPQTNAPPGWTTENPDNWEPASCGLEGLPPIAEMITPGVIPPPEPMRLPIPDGVIIPKLKEGCPDYGADGSLITLRNDAGRNAGLSGCCQSGYHKVEDLEIVDDSKPWWLLGIAGLGLLAATWKKGERR